MSEKIRETIKIWFMVIKNITPKVLQIQNKTRMRLSQNNKWCILFDTKGIKNGKHDR